MWGGFRNGALYILCQIMMLMHSGKELVSKVNFLEIELSHVWKIFVFHLHDNAQVNQDMKVFVLRFNKNKNLKILNKAETKFTG